MCGVSVLYIFNEARCYISCILHVFSKVLCSSVLLLDISRNNFTFNIQLFDYRFSYNDLANGDRLNRELNGDEVNIELMDRNIDQEGDENGEVAEDDGQEILVVLGDGPQLGDEGILLQENLI